ncbi:MAG: hypothetical protein OHK0039_45800 [Bacteroidia bacterium]
MNILHCSLLFGLVCLLLHPVAAQRKPLQVGLGLTGSTYTGEFTEQGSALSRVYPGGHISLQSQDSAALKVELTGGFGRFADQYDLGKPGGSDLTFIETQFYYGDLRLRYRFLPRRRVQPYLAAGAGLIVFTPRDADGRRLDRPSDTLSYNNVIPQLPLGAGVRVRLTPIVGLGLEYTYRFVPSDYLDHIVDPARKGFDALHAVQLMILFTLTPPEP